MRYELYVRPVFAEIADAPRADAVIVRTKGWVADGAPRLRPPHRSDQPANTEEAPNWLGRTTSVDETKRLAGKIAKIRDDERKKVADIERRLPDKIAKMRDDERKSVAGIERRLAKKIAKIRDDDRKSRMMEIEQQFAANVVKIEQKFAANMVENARQFAAEAVESERRWADEAVENARQFAAEAMERKRRWADEMAERRLADRIADIELRIELRLANRPKDVSWKLLERRLLDTLVGELGLSARSSNCLRNRNIRTIGDLISRTEGEIAQIRNLGPKSLAEIKLRLSRRGLGLGDERMSPDTPVVDLVFPDEITQYLDDLGGLIPSIDDDESFDRLIRLESAAAFNFKEELVNAISSVLSPTMPRLACFLERHRDGGPTTTVRNAGESAASCGVGSNMCPVTRERVRRVIAEAGFNRNPVAWNLPTGSRRSSPREMNCQSPFVPFWHRSDLRNGRVLTMHFKCWKRVRKYSGSTFHLRCVWSRVWDRLSSAVIRSRSSGRLRSP